METSEHMKPATEEESTGTDEAGGAAKSPVFRTRWIHILIIFVLGALVYSNTLGAPFQWDEETLILANPVIKDTGYFLDTDRARGTIYYASLKNRYAGYLTFALNYRLHGFKVGGYHLFNISVHLGTALLVYLFVILGFRTPLLMPSRLSGRSGEVALFSALLFVAHPVQTEAVTYIFQRLASMAAMFYLLSVTSYIMSRLSGSARGKYGFYLLSLVSAVIAMKTKENAFTLPLAITLYEVFFFKGPVKRRLKWLAPILLTLIIVPLGVAGLEKTAGETLKGLISLPRGFTEVTRAEYLFTQFRVLVTYIRLLVLPVNQNIDYAYPVYESLFDVQVFLSLGFLAGVLGAGVYLFKSSKRGDPALRLASFGIFWFFLTLSVESSLIPIPMLINEYRLYLPSTALSAAFVTGGYLALGGLSIGDVRKGRAVTAIFTAMVLVLSVAAFSRNSVWRTKVGLWEDVVEKSPKKARGHYNLGNHYAIGGQMDEGIEHYREAIRLKPDYIDAHNNMANALRSKGLLDDAIGHYVTALRYNPNYAEAYNNLGAAYAGKGDKEKAIEHYRKAIMLKPGYFKAYHNLGIALQASGKPDEAVRAYGQALQINPNNFEIHFNLGLLLGYMGRSEKAIEHYEHVIKLKPNYVIAYNNAGIEYKNLNRIDRSNQYFQKALTLDPRNHRVYNNLGNNYFVEGRLDEAMEHYEFALRLKPDYPDVHNNIGNALKAKGRLDDAITSFARAIELKPAYAEAHFNLAMGYYEKKRPAKSIEHFMKAIEAKPGYEKAHLNLGVLYYQKGLFKEARDEFEAALKINPDNARARDYLNKAIKKI